MNVKKIADSIIKNANFPELDQKIKWFEDGLEHLNELKKRLIKIEKIKVFGKTLKFEDVKLVNGWGSVKLIFEDQRSPEQNEKYANEIYTILDNNQIPTHTDKWTHGDFNTIGIQLGKL